MRLKPGMKAPSLAGILVAAVVSLSFALAMGLISLPSLEEAVAHYGGIHAITSYNEFREKVLESEGPVAVMFKTPWCPTCNRVYTYWAPLERKSPVGGVYFYSVVYSDETEALFREYGVVEVPTYILFVGGEPVKRATGHPDTDNMTRSFIEWATAGMNARTENGGESKSGVSLFTSSAPIIAFLAGVGVAFSPCAFPLLVARIVSAKDGVRALSAVKCGIVSGLSMVSLGSLFAVAGALAGDTQGVLVGAAGGIVLSMGLAGLTGAAPHYSLRLPLNGGLFCLLYGVASIQCSLPLFAAAMALMYSASSFGSGLASLAGFTLGVIAPLTGSLYLAARYRRAAEKLILVVSRGSLERASHAVLSLAGAMVLAGAFGLL